MPKNSKISRGGDAGEVFVAARRMRGEGSITANGGNGSIGGKGGKVTVISEDNQLKGDISAKGGKSLQKANWYQKWWGILILGIIAGIVVLLLRQYFIF